MALPRGRFFIGLLFRTMGNAGWVETFFPVADTYPNMLIALDGLNTLAMNCLYEGVQCPRITVSDMAIPGDLQERAEITEAHGKAPDPKGGLDPSIAAVIQCESGFEHRSTRFVRGLPVNCYVPGQQHHFTKGDAGSSSLPIYAGGMVNSFCIWSRPGKRNNFTPTMFTITRAFPKPRLTGFVASIRRAGRPFDLPRGRRMTG